MKYSIIDIGSNSIRLHLYNYDGDHLSSLMRKKTIAGLALFIENEVLTNRGINKLISVLRSYKEIIDVLNIDKSYIFATAAIRNAKNREEIVKEVKDVLDLEIEIISGDDEALYGYYGIRQEYDFSNGAIIDIGGGSTEVSILKEKEIIFETSIKEGALSLQKKFVSKVLPSQKEIVKMKAYVKDLMDQQEIPKDDNYDIYGIGGTIRSCGNISKEFFDLYSSKVIRANLVKSFSKKLMAKKNKVLSQVLKVNPERIHILIPGMIIFNELIERLNPEMIFISDNGLREGYLSTMIDKDLNTKKRNMLND